MLKAFKEAGTAPVKSLLERVSSDKFAILPNSLGMLPVSEFALLSHSDLWKSNISAPLKGLAVSPGSGCFWLFSLGMLPVSEFTASQRFFKFDKLPSSAGIVPLSELLWSISEVKLVRFPSSLGILPLSELPLR